MRWTQVWKSALFVVYPELVESVTDLCALKVRIQIVFKRFSFRCIVCHSVTHPFLVPEKKVRRRITTSTARRTVRYTIYSLGGFFRYLRGCRESRHVSHAITIVETPPTRTAST
ncbi:hypothetical protein PISMIDRAFT_452778 [Pisolithus microcarpus 441]|uniref:Secreted protein n=1 Tax=Pisolithus microcarpus 441 TaxID=765257 RepID=A0A0C9YES4_9AGAM|nr:hypothetical protein PISMIDRAFT_452778 [Pisolithus microcarpus 441]